MNHVLYISIIYMLPHLCLVSAKDGYFLADKYEIQPYRKRVAFGTPCKIMVDPTLQKELSAHYSDFVNSKPIQCKSAIAWEWYYCTFHQTRLIKLLTKLPSSIIVTRHKRDILEWLNDNSKRLAEIGGEAASLFIRGLSSNPFVSTSIEMAKTILEQLIKRTQSDYDNKSLVPMDIITKTVSDVSRFAGQRPELLRTTVEAENYEDNFIDYMHDEFKAAEVLIKSIEQMLKIGKLDTQALGELIDDTTLMDIDPTTTRILYIENPEGVNGLQPPDSSEVELIFHFELIKELTLLERFKLASIVVCLTIGIFVALILNLMVNYQRSMVIFSGRERNSNLRSHIDLESLDNIPPPLSPTILEPLEQRCSSLRGSMRSIRTFGASLHTQAN